MNYREAVEKDIDSLTNLFDGYRVFYRKESDKPAAKLFLLDRLKNKDATIFVAEDDKGELIGFVQLYPLFSSTRMQKFWLLNDLFVNSEYRGNGVSVGLINKAKELVKKSGACGMSLETEISNLIGNKLYPKTGFELNTSCNFYEWTVS